MTDATSMSRRKWMLAGLVGVLLAVVGFLLWPMVFGPRGDKDTRTLRVGVHGV